MRVPPFARATCLLAVVLSIAACGKDEAQAKGKQEGDRPIPVTMEVVRQQPWSDTILALGTAKARESVTVTAKVSETVQRVHFDSGDEVARRRAAGHADAASSSRHRWPRCRPPPRKPSACTSARANSPRNSSSRARRSTRSAPRATPRARRSPSDPRQPRRSRDHARRSTACSASARSARARW